MHFYSFMYLFRSSIQNIFLRPRLVQMWQKNSKNLRQIHAARFRRVTRTPCAFAEYKIYIFLYWKLRVIFSSHYTEERDTYIFDYVSNINSNARDIWITKAWYEQCSNNRAFECRVSAGTAARPIVSSWLRHNIPEKHLIPCIPMVVAHTRLHLIGLA